MQFLQKINKLVSIILMAAGGTVATASVIMLGVSTQSTYTLEVAGVPQKFCIGSVNFYNNLGMEQGHNI